MLSQILQGLNEAGVDYVVVGGIAANVQGSPRLTQDVDICYDPSPENRERLAKRLAAWHAYMRGVEPGLPFYMDARTLRDVPVLTLVTDVGDLDVMDRVAGVGDYPEVLAASEAATVEGIPARALSLDALIASKKAAGRRKDLEALLELEALREERRRRGM
ncbi:MAG: nucleotidyltransferase [Gemmatimonadales bacterium]|nr:nucleotidyltransferase [Gemmatimonadales bacterium]